jgi:hypothetical protein
MHFLQEYGIKGFPTIKVFSPGKPPVDYQGARDVKPIVEFALSQVCCIRCYLDGLYFSSICSLAIFQSLEYILGRRYDLCSYAFAISFYWTHFMLCAKPMQYAFQKTFRFSGLEELL